MLIERKFLDELAAGRIDLAFRRWPRARVKAGTRLSTAIGIVEVVSIDVVTLAAIDARAVRRAGYSTRAALLAELRGRKGRVHRIRLRRTGPDPRRALARRSRMDAAERRELRGRLDRMDSRSRGGSWVWRTLRLIAAHPGTGAATLSAKLGLSCGRSRPTSAS